MNGLLKFITCGSVDDGKSTLIGNILYNSKLLYTDQEEALQLDSKIGSRDGKIDYSLLLDGLMAEREQGITIDVAYRYFNTDNRSFIVADTPGHEEYTRNMAVGASFAELSIILIDASKGVLSQTKRHARICTLMGIEYFVFAINKMDLIDYSQDKFNHIVSQIEELSKEVELKNFIVIPVSATEGDNVTKKSTNISWYEGETLLEYLESVDIQTSNNEVGFYMPVQRVSRPNLNFRGFQGQVESGSISVGDEINVLPSNEKAIVSRIINAGKDVTCAYVGEPITISLDKEVDVSRGCVIEKDSKLSTISSATVDILWTDDVPLKVNQEYLIKVGTKKIVGVVNRINYKVDVNTGTHIDTNELSKNELASCEIYFAEKIIADKFKSHKTMGEFILIDRVSNMTSACGVITNYSSDAQIDDSVSNKIKVIEQLSKLGYNVVYADDNTALIKF